MPRVGRLGHSSKFLQINDLQIRPGGTGFGGRVKTLCTLQIFMTVL
jgi:hypothetical protein